MTKVLSAILATFLLAIAGCTSSGDDTDPDPSDPDPMDPDPTDPDPTDPDPTDPDPTDPGPTDPDPSDNNTAPQATLGVITDELNATFTVNGTDQEGDALSWTLDVDGDGVADYSGDAVPASVLHRYALDGSYNATLTLSDGEFTDQALLLVSVAMATSVGQSFTGSFLGGMSILECTGSPGLPDIEDIGNPNGSGISFISTTIADATRGLDFTATFAALERSDLSYFGVSFRNADGEEIEYLESEVAGTMVAGTVHATATHVAFYACFGAADVTVSYEV